MKPQTDSQEAYREVLSNLGRNLQLFKQAQRLGRRLAAMGAAPDACPGCGIGAEELAAGRNRLVFEWLPAIDRCSIRSCNRAIRLLEAQRQRVLPEIERLQRELRFAWSGSAAGV